jgi:hypothetical protein
MELVEYLANVITAIVASEQVVYSASHIDCVMMEGMVDVTSMTVPRMKIKYRPVDRQLLLGQS